MCGLVGVVGVNAVDERHLIPATIRSMAHRGPDAEGNWSEPDALFAHRRLVVLDLTTESNQPIISPCGRFVLTYNGEIYNYQSLVDPTLGSDTLTLAKAMNWSDPERLRGMFAYSVWDREKHSLRLVRDRFGMKPMYYSSTDNSIVFSSTARGAATIRRNLEPNLHGVASFLRWGSVQGPTTIYSAVDELDPGSMLSWCSGSVERNSYWAFQDTKNRGSEDSLNDVLAESVDLHTLSDVPVAVFLSGGLDSALIAALAVTSGAEITALTLGFSGLSVDETDEARATAQAFGLKHEVIDLGASVPNFDAYFAATDQPTIDGLNTFLISQAASIAGFRVALSGAGADELFAGYSMFRRGPALALANALFPSAVTSAILGRSPGNRTKSAGLQQAGSSFSELHEELRSVFTRNEVSQLTGIVPTIVEDEPDRLTRSVDSFTRLEIQSYLRNTLLRDSDIFGMAHSVEIRTPYVDDLVLAAALAISNPRRLIQRKRLLADSVDHDRLKYLARMPKKGFTLPMGKWLRSSLADRVSELTKGPIGGLCRTDKVAALLEDWNEGRCADTKIWSLVVLDAWLRHENQASI